MSSKQSPAKVTLSMIKGKPITMSVPVIRYRASDDELEELYPSTDDEKRLTPESEKTSPKPSPRKSRVSIEREDGEIYEGMFGKRSSSVDENLSEGIPPSDPWRKLSQIKGKITKTFEEKISEMKEKNEKKKSKHNRSRDTSSISDYEDLGDLTPTEETSQSDKQEKDSPVLKKRTHSSKFGSFSGIKIGLKAKKSKDYSVESGVEASELNYEDSNEGVGLEKEDKIISEANIVTKFPKIVKPFLPNIFQLSNSEPTESDRSFIQLKHKLYYQLFIMNLVLWCCYFSPLPQYVVGVVVGVFISAMFKKMYETVSELLSKIYIKSRVPVLQIPAVEEHVIVEKYEGWLNELPYNYEPDNYHVARTRSVFLKLEKEILKVMETRTRISKRATWDEPKHRPKFTRKRVYSLNNAKIELLPDGLIRIRRWSKKYPICITLEKNALLSNTAIKRYLDEDPETSEVEINNKSLVEEENDDDISEYKDSKDRLEDCEDEELDEEKIKIYIFARTDRQKEDWFRRLQAAANLQNKRGSFSSAKDVSISANASSQGNNETKPPTPSGSSPENLSYQAYMARYAEMTLRNSKEPGNCDILWINALIGRVFFDMFKCPDAVNLLQQKIQRKLLNIKLPYFMESLFVSELVIGQGAPVIHSATKPVNDERGVWFDLDISYDGSITMTIETKLNLMKLKKAEPSPSVNSDITGVDKAEPSRSAIFHSDVEDTPETSTEDEDSSVPVTPVASTSRDNTPAQSSGKKLLNMVEKLSSNKYFQHATKLSYVQRAMEGVSKTEIRLMVSLTSIEGWLTVNIPPSPADRIWYGFKPVPKVNLRAKPGVGEREFKIVYITKWIETKLLKEFEKVVVLPNMDDLIIPLCPNFPYNESY